MRLGKTFWTIGAGFAAIAGVTPAQAQSVAPTEAPRAWLDYAEGATSSVTAWLEEPSDPSTRVRAFLDGTRSAPDQPSLPLVLKIWVDRKGVITRVEHDALKPPALPDDVRTVVVGRKLPPPPRKMLQPMLIAVQVPPAPAAPSPVAAPST